METFSPGTRDRQRERERARRGGWGRFSNQPTEHERERKKALSFICPPMETQPGSKRSTPTCVGCDFVESESVDRERKWPTGESAGRLVAVCTETLSLSPLQCLAKNTQRASAWAKQTHTPLPLVVSFAGDARLFTNTHACTRKLAHRCLIMSRPINPSWVCV